MTVKIMTKEAKKEAVVETSQKVVKLDKQEMEILVDAIGALKIKIEPLMKRLGPLAESLALQENKLRELVDETLPADQKTSIVTDDYIADIGMNGKKTTITDPKACFEWLEETQEGLVYEVMKFGLTELKKYMGDLEFEKYSKSERVNKRIIKIKSKMGEV